MNFLYASLAVFVLSIVINIKFAIEGIKFLKNAWQMFQSEDKTLFDIADAYFAFVKPNVIWGILFTALQTVAQALFWIGILTLIF